MTGSFSNFQATMNLSFLSKLVIFQSLLVMTNGSTYYTGKGTAYTLGETQSGNCNMMYANSDVITNYVAMNAQQWDDMQHCGQCVEVSCIDAQCTKSGKMVLQVLDKCPECAEGSLDISSSVYTELTGRDPNTLDIKWRFVDCPLSGNIEYCLKTGSNDYWIAIQPANSYAEIASMEINGDATTLVDSAYYYKITSTSPATLSAVQVTVISTTGEVIKDTVALAAGMCTKGKYQFTTSTADSASVSAVSSFVQAASSSSSNSTTPTVTTTTPTITHTHTTPTTITATPVTTSASPATTTATPMATTATPAAAPTATKAASTATKGKSKSDKCPF